VLRLVGVNRELKGSAAQLRGSGVDQRVLRPHAGVVELRLVAHRQQRLAVVPMADPLAQATAQLGQRLALDPRRLGRRQ
jgi:hypothetical protein